MYNAEVREKVGDLHLMNPTNFFSCDFALCFLQVSIICDLTIFVLVSLFFIIIMLIIDWLLRIF